jgi:hypothetical protein
MQTTVLVHDEQVTTGYPTLVACDNGAAAYLIGGYIYTPDVSTSATVQARQLAHSYLAAVPYGCNGDGHMSIGVWVKPNVPF